MIDIQERVTKLERKTVDIGEALAKSEEKVDLQKIFSQLEDRAEKMI